jgi:hypothetical protein
MARQASKPRTISKSATSKSRLASKTSPPNKGSDNYTDPKLRERLKKKIMAGSKGGDAGEWSARKSQLLTREYEKAGGGYKTSARTEEQQNLESWTKEKWTTSDGGPSERKGGKVRYLPQEAWDQLGEEEKRKANETKRKGDKTGKQFVANPKAAQDVRRKAQNKKSVRKKSKPDAGRDPLTT